MVLPRPATAYNEYALRAFDVSALDYLVKPIEPRRLAHTVERVLDAWRAEAARPLPDDPSGTDRATAPLSPRDRVFVTQGERTWLIELGFIRLFESEGGYTRVFFDDEKPLINRSLNHLESRLDPRVFFRANRSQIYGTQAIAGIRTDPRYSRIRRHRASAASGNRGFRRDRVRSSPD